MKMLLINVGSYKSLVLPMKEEYLKLLDDIVQVEADRSYTGAFNYIRQVKGEIQISIVNSEDIQPPRPDPKAVLEGLNNRKAELEKELSKVEEGLSKVGDC